MPVSYEGNSSLCVMYTQRPFKASMTFPVNFSGFVLDGRDRIRLFKRFNCFSSVLVLRIKDASVNLCQIVCICEVCA